MAKSLSPHISTYLHISPHISIYLHISPYISIYLHSTETFFRWVAKFNKMKGRCGSISSIRSMIRSRWGRTTWAQRSPDSWHALVAGCWVNVADTLKKNKVVGCSKNLLTYAQEVWSHWLKYMIPELGCTCTTLQCNHGPESPFVLRTVKGGTYIHKVPNQVHWV